MIKVGVNGYGTIGKRVAYAVSKQKDMELIGVTKTSANFEAMECVNKGIDLYAAVEERIPDFEKKGIKLAGRADELFDKVDLVVDCTPGKEPEMAQSYKSTYKEKGLKAIFQGGEPHELTGFSFNALWSYDEAKGKQFARVVSCNTTGLCRSIWAVSQVSKIERIDAVMVRRTADPGNSKSGPVNAIVPEVKVPSHHGPDVQSVIGPQFNINTMAVKVPTTIMHEHNLMMHLADTVTEDRIIKSMKDTPRIVLVKTKDGFKSTAEVMEYARDLGRPWSDLYEIAVWEDSIHIKDGVLYFCQAVHQESDVIPEEIDCIRAMLGSMKKGQSMKETDKTLGVVG
ncbi:MAG: type II glyceraldehyde-3-phosphate dehydrogenase [Candidatus Altiarchaeota archaeon]|nr:type II glyceraldehyde-3-phosphate dehydrogenase [Candidatus Altiarchaeota archaeon]